MDCDEDDGPRWFQPIYPAMCWACMASADVPIFLVALVPGPVGAAAMAALAFLKYRFAWWRSAPPGPSRVR